MNVSTKFVTMPGGNMRIRVRWTDTVGARHTKHIATASHSDAVAKALDLHESNIGEGRIRPDGEGFDFTVRMTDSDLLTAYTACLKAAGFRVWLTRTSPSSGYLTYEHNGFYGHLQQSYFDGWQHDMPIVPSRENGSSMFIEDPLPAFTVEAAEQAAQAYNTNSAVDRQVNAGDKTWISPKSEEL